MRDVENASHTKARADSMGIETALVALCRSALAARAFRLGATRAGRALRRLGLAGRRGRHAARLAGGRLAAYELALRHRDRIAGRRHAATAVAAVERGDAPGRRGPGGPARRALARGRHRLVRDLGVGACRAELGFAVLRVHVLEAVNR